MQRVWNRVYANFLMPDRTSEYRSLLERALELGYQVLSLSRFWAVTQRDMNPCQRYLVLRQDVDSDVSTARRMFAIERSLGVTSSYFFRLSTLEPELMGEIESHGSEASYHFEEIAAAAKLLGLKSRAEVTPHMSRIRESFAANLTRLRALTGLPMRTVASHGDFVNRRLRMYNWELLDQPLRNRLGIELEAYDESLLQQVSTRLSDTHYPQFWKPIAAADLLTQQLPVIYLLVHPRHWHTNIAANISVDSRRLWEGLIYSFR